MLRPLRSAHPDLFNRQFPAPIGPNPDLFNRLFPAPVLGFYYFLVEMLHPLYLNPPLDLFIRHPDRSVKFGSAYPLLFDSFNRRAVPEMVKSAPPPLPPTCERCGGVFANHREKSEHDCNTVRKLVRAQKAKADRKAKLKQVSSIRQQFACHDH
jgi:hypothetical protein